MECKTCSETINGMTGLQELQNFREHMKEAHGTEYTVEDAAEERITA